MDEKFHPTLCTGFDHLSILGFKSNHVSKRGTAGEENKHWIHRELFSSHKMFITLRKFQDAFSWYHIFADADNIPKGSRCILWDVIALMTKLRPLFI